MKNQLFVSSVFVLLFVKRPLCQHFYGDKRDELCLFQSLTIHHCFNRISRTENSSRDLSRFVLTFISSNSNELHNFFFFLYALIFLLFPYFLCCSIPVLRAIIFIYPRTYNAKFSIQQSLSSIIKSELIFTHLFTCSNSLDEDFHFRSCIHPPSPSGFRSLRRF